MFIFLESMCQLLLSKHVHIVFSLGNAFDHIKRDDFHGGAQQNQRRALSKQ